MDTSVRDIHNLATQLLNTTKLVQDLQSFGEVKVTGSYAYNLMTKPDIDIYIIDSNLKGTAKKVLNFIIDREIFNFGIFQNCTTKPKKNSPNGFYIALNKRIKGIKFNIDIWIINNENDYFRIMTPGLNEYLLSGKLTEEQRNTILNLKKYRDDNNISITASIIYDAVINHNIKTFENLTKLINARN